MPDICNKCGKKSVIHILTRDEQIPMNYCTSCGVTSKICDEIFKEKIKDEYILNNISKQNIDNVFLKIAKDLSILSKCISKQVGAIIVKDGRIISTGINGTPPGFINCCDQFPNGCSREEHHKFSEMYEIHAEQNAIIRAAKSGISINNADLYTTLQPCNDCLKIICNSGIKRIFYSELYDKFNFESEIINMLEKCNVKLIKVK